MKDVDLVKNKIYSVKLFSYLEICNVIGLEDISAQEIIEAQKYDMTYSLAEEFVRYLQEEKTFEQCMQEGIEAAEDAKNIKRYNKVTQKDIMMKVAIAQAFLDAKLRQIVLCIEEKTKGERTIKGMLEYAKLDRQDNERQYQTRKKVNENIHYLKILFCNIGKNSEKLGFRFYELEKTYKLLNFSPSVIHKILEAEE